LCGWRFVCGSAFPEKGKCPWCKPWYCSLCNRPEDRAQCRKCTGQPEDWLVERREMVACGGWKVLVSRPGVSHEVQVPAGGTWLSVAHQIQHGKPVCFLEGGASVAWLPRSIPPAPRQATAPPTAQEAARMLGHAETEDGVDGEVLVSLLEARGCVPEALHEQLEEIRGGEATVELLMKVLLAIDSAAS